MHSFGDVITEIVRCTDRAAVGQVVKTELSRFGYSSSACASYQRGRLGLSADHYFRNWTPDWVAFTAEQKLGQKWFTVPEASRRTMPFTWADVPNQRALSGPEREALDAAHFFGWKNGIVVPIHGPNGYLGLFGMATDEPDVDASSIANQRLVMIGHLAHQRCLSLQTHDIIDPVDRISPRELECLQWVAIGKTDWEIGEILSLSPHTVKMHIDRARRRLGATTRAQATARIAIAGKLLL